jgi:hypothetical protein
MARDNDDPAAPETAAERIDREFSERCGVGANPGKIGATPPKRPREARQQIDADFARTRRTNPGRIA